MMRYVIVTMLLLSALFTQAACKSAPKFSEIQDKDWYLIEVRHLPEEIVFDRHTLKEEGFDTIFTLRFDNVDQRINGIGAPNNYFAPYALSDKQGIAIKPIASTLMVAIHEPEKLKERDYFTYLQNVNRWNLSEGNLQLYSVGEDGVEVIMTFIASDRK